MLLKVVVLVIVVLALWYGVRWMARVQRVLERQERQAEHRAAEHQMEQRREKPRAAEPVAADMQRCPVCAIFVTGTASCGKDACPYG